MFAIQSELAQSIAGALLATLSPQGKKFLDRRPTDNLAAYECLLEYRAIGSNAARQDERLRLLNEAIALDANLSEASAQLALMLRVEYSRRDRQDRALMRAAGARCGVGDRGGGVFVRGPGLGFDIRAVEQGVRFGAEHGAARAGHTGERGGEIGIDEQEGGSGVADDAGILRGVEAKIHRYKDVAASGVSIQGVQKAGGIGRHNRDAFAGPDAKAVESGGIAAWLRARAAICRYVRRPKDGAGCRVRR